ncbi:MAG: cytochrome c5 family protein [Porticoccaceae bacterium]
MGKVIKTGLSATAVALLLTLGACSGEQEEVTLTPAQQEAVAERLKPEGEVTLESDVVATAPAIDATGGEPRDPEEIYNKACVTCHAVGVAGAPKIGVAADWEPRIAQGMDVLYTHSLEGLRGMPPRGLCMDCTDDEIKSTVDYMVKSSQ